MKKLSFIFLLFVGICFAQKPVFTSAKVTHATVYFNSAELTQSAKVSVTKGNNEIVVKNVADYLNENTLKIGVPNNVTVLSSQFTKDYISEYEIDETSPQTKMVRDSINLLQKEIARANNELTAKNKTIELLDKNQRPVGDNTPMNMTELTKWVDYYQSKRMDLSNLADGLKEKLAKLNEKLSKLNARLELNVAKDEKVSNGKLILQVMSETAGNIDLELNYLTSNASWAPSYDLRVDNVTSLILLKYKAMVIQKTGIDWKKVQLKLSSGNPNQNNQAPLLNAWFLRYAATVDDMLNGRVAGLNYQNTIPSSERAESKVMGSYSTIDKGVSDFTTVNENQLNVSFDIAIPYDILSNGKQHSIVMNEIQLPAQYKYYTVPKLESESYLLAEINDYGKFNLLPGEANVVFEGMFVGKTMINTNQTKDTLNLSMGRDKRVSVKREKVIDKSSTKFLSNNAEQVFTYDITVKNNKNSPIEIIVKDQYPLSTDKDITVELLDSSRAKDDKEKGILTWIVNMKSGETKTFRISYKVRYPKDKKLENL